MRTENALDTKRASETWRSTGAGLFVRRKDIHFQTESDGTVGIEITVRNEADDESAETRARIFAAPLGAFVSWRPVGEVPVPPIPAGGRVTVRVRAHVSRPPVVGRLQDVTPGRLLTASDLIDRGFQRGPLPADPLQVLEHGSVHWAGNLNVFVNRTPVERHRAMALRIHPGRTNLALFFVGSGPDSYSFQLRGEGTAWGPTLHDVVRVSWWRRMKLGRPLPTGEWVAIRSVQRVLLAVRPPVGCGRGSLDVLVRQRSTGRSALVEFCLDEAAEGPGCYTV